MKFSTIHKSPMLLVTLWLLAGPVLHAQELDLVDEPLFLNASLEPNVMVNFDDSGSMEWAFMPTDISGLRNNARGASARINGVMYDPWIDYEPPIDADGDRYPEHPFTDSCDRGMSDPCTAADDGDGVDLSSNYHHDWYYDWTNRRWFETNANTNGGYYYTHYEDHPQGLQAVPANCNATNDSDNDCYIKIEVQDGNTGPGATDERQNFSNWYSYYRRRTQLAKSGALIAFGNLGGDMRVAWQKINDASIEGPTMDRMEGTHRDDFFDWLAGVPATGSTPLLRANKLTGEYFSDTSSGNPWESEFEVTPGVYETKEFSCRQSYQVILSDGEWNSWTPSVGNEDNTNTTFPDGKSYTTNDGENDIYSDGNSNFMADQAFLYWATDLRPDLDDNVRQFSNVFDGADGVEVTVPDGDDPFTYDEVYWNPGNDPADWQHVVNFAIGMGVDGARDFSDADDDGVPDDYPGLRTGATAWGNDHIDDLWHGAINSRGQYFSAGDPTELVEAFTGVLKNIIERQASASAVSVSAGVVTTASQAFETVFDPANWSGSVRAYTFTSDGHLQGPVWDAACELDGGTCESTGGDSGEGLDWDLDRVILTFDPSGGTTVPFRWNSGVTTDQQAFLDTDPVTNTDDGLGEERLNYLRGDSSLEIQNGGTFRNRDSLMGDVVNSAAVYVGAPNLAYRDNWPDGSAEDSNPYSAFSSANASREGRVYIGANDGMLHALDGVTGEERWAYIPDVVVPNLNLLTDTIDGHQGFVDATVSIKDAYLGGWKSVVVGGLRLGGQGFYAVDVTTPDVTEDSPGGKVLWEFTDANGSPNMGYSYGSARIERINYNNKWVAFLPNGYNNTEADGHSGSGTAVLFVVDLQTGSIIKEFDTGAGSLSRPNGLASPMGADIDGDNIVDFLVAGDLMGNLWRFDVSDSSISNWEMDLMFDPATDWAQPITTVPRMIWDDRVNTLNILFGTGKYIENQDRIASLASTQYFIGLRDYGAAAVTYPIELSDLLEQSISTTGTTRATTSNSISSELGWYVELPMTGERVVTTPVRRVSSHRIIFSTFIPQGDDPCLAGGTSWLMALDSRDGSTPDGVATLDFNQSGTLDDGDSGLVGMKLDDFIVGLTPVMPVGGGSGYLLPGGTGAATIAPIQAAEFDWRRRGWREMFLNN